MASTYDPRKISSWSDLKVAKERYRYDILVRQQALTSSSGYFRKAVRATLSTAMQNVAQIIVAVAIRKLFRSRSKRR